MSTATNKLTATPAAPRRNWKAFLVFVFEKLGENINDMIVTVAALAMLLAYLLLTVPEMAIANSGYIIAGYMLILFLRIVHDFDDSYTNDELGTRLDLILDFQREIYRRQRDETSVPASDLEERLDSLL